MRHVANEKSKLLNRLRRLRGQITAIERAVEGKVILDKRFLNDRLILASNVTFGSATMSRRRVKKSTGRVPGSRRQSRIADTSLGTTLGARRPSKPVTLIVSISVALASGLARSLPSRVTLRCIPRCLPTAASAQCLIK